MAVNWDKLAAKAGFGDGATAKDHYEPLLNRDHGHGRARTTVCPQELRVPQALRPGG
ncbi:hypothetical protein GGR55DRAFT_674266 [Xylaria sp. FL0064]|nr:hypothetical protein GGR55DRAFT_674266 [Xylaria sp. FL0064]